jgi:hypothetical protein
LWETILHAHALCELEAFVLIFTISSFSIWIAIHNCSAYKQELIIFTTNIFSSEFKEKANKKHRRMQKWNIVHYLFLSLGVSTDETNWDRDQDFLMTWDQFFEIVMIFLTVETSFLMSQFRFLKSRLFNQDCYRDCQDL